MSESPKKIDIKEFRETGFLQEANRLFFHPRGLALEVVIEEDGTERLGGVWDYRDDPEGILYGTNVDEQTLENRKEKCIKVIDEEMKHYALRMMLFGVYKKFEDSIQPTEGNIQPLDWKEREMYENC